jgi:hypothetical protein
MLLRLLTYYAQTPLRLLPFCSRIPKSDLIFHRMASPLYLWLHFHSSLMISSTIDGSSPWWQITCIIANYLMSLSIRVMYSTLSQFRVMRLTRGILLKQPDWDEWQLLEYLQLNQYDAQGMFSQPVLIAEKMAVFHLVWTYAIKALDSRKKAQWACDGSPRSGQAKILDDTYANCVDQTSSQLFYAVSAAENLLIYGTDVSNAFAEAPPPKQGFYIYPDRAFREW